MSSFLCHKFACAFFVDCVPCTVVQTVTTSTWYTELCKVSNTTIFRTGLQSSEATASVSQCQSSERQPFFPAPPSILTRRHAQLCFDTVLWHSGGMLHCASAILGSTFTWRSAKPALEILLVPTICSLHLFIRKYFWKSTILSRILTKNRLPPWKKKHCLTRCVWRNVRERTGDSGGLTISLKDVEVWMALAANVTFFVNRCRCTYVGEGKNT